MPLLSGQENIGENIKTLTREGKSQKQAEAIALNVAGKSKNAAVTTSPGGSNTYAPSTKEDEKDKWIYKKHISIFDAHDGVEEDLDIDFTPEVLQQMVDQNNERLSKGCQCPIIVEGHTDEDGIPDPDNIVGWCDNFVVDDFQGVKHIFCDMKFLKSRYQEVEKLSCGMDMPRRSVEVWQDMILDPVKLSKFEKPILDVVALLGGERPARPLPQKMNNSFKNLQVKSKYNYEVKRSYAMDETQFKEICEKLMNLPAMKWVEEQMNKSKLAEDEAKKAEEDKPKMDYEEEDEKKEEFEADDEDKKKEDFAAEDEEDEKKKMRNDQSKRKYAKLEMEYKALFNKVATLEKKERVATRKNDLMQLEAEGYQFDMVDELDTVADYDNDRFKKHIKLIKKNYKKAPIGVNINAEKLPEHGADGATKVPTAFETFHEADIKARGKYSNFDRSK